MFKFNEKDIACVCSSYVKANRINQLTLNGFSMKEIVEKLNKHRTLHIKHREAAEISFNLLTNTFENIKMLGNEVYGDSDLYTLEIWNASFDEKDQLEWKLFKSTPPPKSITETEDEYLENNAVQFIYIDELDYFGCKDEILKIIAVRKKNKIVTITVQSSI